MLTEKLKEYHIILGSVSPRRRELLADLGISFDIADPDISEECPPSVLPENAALYLAELKADKLALSLGRGQILITADTTVLCDDIIMPKPESREQAVEFLRALSGRSHRVITGVCIVSDSNHRNCFSVETTVIFSKLDEDEIAYYVDEYKPYDKAGAYGIQEWIGMVATERIEGSWFNVMGLPVESLYRELKKFTEQSK
ncbi:MAG: Maf family protein [Bacteroidales bacterium]|jgi:septum formation protein|nr:Maf family protein [Bacteroidales bacterium]